MLGLCNCQLENTEEEPNVAPGQTEYTDSITDSKVKKLYKM